MRFLCIIAPAPKKGFPAPQGFIQNYNIISYGYFCFRYGPPPSDPALLLRFCNRLVHRPSLHKDTPGQQDAGAVGATLSPRGGLHWIAVIVDSKKRDTAAKT
jgi:hypothetical protein